MAVSGSLIEIMYIVVQIISSKAGFFKVKVVGL